MGTRNLICVVLDKEYKIAQYGQWDGYPDGQGQTVLDFILNEMDIKMFKKKLRKLRWITHEDIDNINREHSEDWDEFYPHLYRNMGANILRSVQERDIKFLKNSLDFAKDSLFCEFAYVIDLDKKILEVYTGFNHFPLSKKERFYFGGEVKESPSGKYYPIKLYKKYKFSELHASVMHILQSEMNEEEEE